MSFILPIGAKAVDFTLTANDDRVYAYSDLKGSRGTLIFFTCNHCPHVMGSEDRMQALNKKCESLGISMVAIHSNETVDHPEDHFDLVKTRMIEKGFTWIALDDNAQKVARQFGAERTPHYFLFDDKDNLVYRGRMDNSPRDINKAITHELEDAIQEMLAGSPVTLAETAAVGCNIKWWGKDKHWMPADACDLDYLDVYTPAKKN